MNRLKPMPDLPVLHTKRLQLRILSEQSAAAVLDYYTRNRLFHQPWFASRGDDVFTLRQQQANLAVEYSDFLAGRAVPFWIFRQDDPGRVIGRFALTNIVRGCFQSCFAAYHLDQDCQGAGLASEAGQAAIRSIFSDFGLHRVEANIMLSNHRSQALAERLGFRLEGHSARYLEINGIWEDHQHWVRMSDDETLLADDPLIETENLIIRQLLPKDIPWAMQYHQRNLGQIGAWNPLPAGDVSDESTWYRLFSDHRVSQAAGRRLDLGIFFKDRPQWLAGTIECQNIAALPFSSCEIGFSIDRLLSGRGLMLEALNSTIRWLFARYGFQRISARCAAGNDRSIRLLEMLGFRPEGTERQAIWLNDSWHDVICSGLLRGEFYT